MDWSDSHLHEYEIAGENYSIPDPDGWRPTVNPEARKTLVKALNGKRTFKYLHDFGDSWHHSIKVEKYYLLLPVLRLRIASTALNKWFKRIKV